MPVPRVARVGQGIRSRSSSSVDALFVGVEKYFGSLDVVANVAGIYPIATVAGTTDELWNDVMTTNLTGVFYCCRAAVRTMVPQGRGCIINVASGAAEIPYAGLAAYSASKGGVESLTRALAKEVSPAIRVNAVAPGPTLTWPPDESGLDASTNRSGNDEGDSDRFIAAATITSTIPLGRWMHPEEIADAIAFLASEQATAIFGQILRVNGGNHMA
jgi:NAD(P)-dependent dehydrogenase (short-subunit alcohol dehydrogenase family)